MNVKKEVYDIIIHKLNDEMMKINYKIHTNKYTFKALEKEQTVLKRERVELQKLINGFQNKITKEVEG